MISTVSLSFDLTYVDPLTGTVIPRCVVTDSTTYPIPVDLFSAKGYGVLSFNGDVIEAKDTVLNPLIDLEAFETTGFINLPLDNNGNVANGVYGFEYSLRLDSTASGVGIVGTVTGGTTFTSGAEWLVEVLPIGSSIAIDGVNNTVAGAVVVGSDAVITLGAVAVNGTAKPLTFIDDVSLQFSATYAYAGCTQTSADVDFIYDCEYGNSGTWSVSNATVLGANEIVTSLNCVINYPSWTSSNPLFNPQVVTNVLPYPTLPGDNTPLATGTYSVSLSEQIQQTQASGLVVLYNKSVIKEFAVSCAGTLCGLVPCIENLRAAHAAELIRNKVSKYQVYVDNVALYYLEAMNYKACGELDKYKETISLLEAQLDASGCDCACCDDQSYYWVSNNSANSIIDEILENFQFRLYTGPGAPSATEVGVELGALWEDTTTGILYRCTGATPGSLTWALYYDPSEVVQAVDVSATATAPLTATNVQGQLNEIATNAIFGATNGLTESGDDVKLGGALTELTTIDVGSYFLSYPVTTGFISVSKSTSGFPAMVVSGVDNAFAAQVTDDFAGVFAVNRTTTDNTVAKNIKVQTGTTGVVGNGFGASLEFVLENTTAGTPTTSSIKSSWENAASQNSKLELTTALAGVESTVFTLNSDGSATLPSYGGGIITGTAAQSLSVDSSGNVIETPFVKVFAAKVTNPSPGNYAFQTITNTTGGTVTITYSSNLYTISSSNNAFTVGKTLVLGTLEIGNTNTFNVFPGLSPDIILIQTAPYSGSNYDALINAVIKIEIYP